MNIKSILERLNTINYNSDGYVLFKINNINDVYFGRDAKGYIVFVIESSSPQVKPSSQITKDLRFDFNSCAEIILDGQKLTKYIHMLTCLSNNSSDIEAFLRLSQAFVLNGNINDINYLNKLFNSFVSLFAKESKPTDKEIQGLFAELFVLYYFEKLGFNLYDYWQSKDKMKFDFSITEKKRLEIKSTSRQVRIHHFLHEQLLTDFYDIKIISLIMRKADKGLSLLDLVNEIRNSKSANYNILLHIEKLVKKLTQSDMANCIYDNTILESQLKIFSAEDIPHFNEKQPNGVFNTEYDCDLTNIKDIAIKDLINWIKI
ncbi:MAG: PD-(D/E)XK motif protein [Candidatus Cloacimonetes bacterium]|nr:PD-(D/E)XK motif protein [Candidatus Cloacimonadota bacterium]